MKFHVTDAGPKRCVATVGTCKYGAPTEHFATEAEAYSAFEQGMSGVLLSGSRKRRPPAPVDIFGLDPGQAYGTMAPRSIQLEALNGVVAALAEDDQTQLVAACGTGKTYMGRQLMRHMMEQEDSTGVAIVLTSSIKLAEDTADDMRPTGGYDQSFGVFGEDYEVIEVHSSARPKEGRPSVLEGGSTVSVERIREQLEEALAAGKKVVIVSTYDSASKVQEAQALLSDPKKGEADILMHDEAHNILGMQTPTAITEAQNSSYRSFHNSIPGALQARKRLYATATPVVPEIAGDKPSTEDVEGAIAVARAMETDKKARITFYSSDEAIVGKVGGYISQAEAIQEGYLTRPDYQLREATVRGDARAFSDPAVLPSGELVEQKERKARDEYMTPQTYAAVSATLNAMVADAPAGQNPVHNALLYTSGQKQAYRVREDFAAVALAQSGGMELAEAERLKDSEAGELRHRARLRLLAEHATVMAATSDSPMADKRAAFAMFTGKSYTTEERASGWSPHKRVLANVDIFSEGVSIPEIDTVVMANDDKTAERTMTQAIGRSLRVVGGNTTKNTGHVIVPLARDEQGRALTEGSAAVAAYGATRVERGVAIAKLQGTGVRPDETTVFSTYDASGVQTGAKPAQELAREALTGTDELIATYAVERVHQRLRDRSGDTAYMELSPRERFERIRSELHEDAKSKKNEHEKAQAARAASYLEGRDHLYLHQLRKNGRVVHSALSAGDMGALPETLREGLIRSGHVAAGTAQSVTLAEKRAVLERDPAFVAALLAAAPTGGKTVEGQQEAREAVFGAMTPRETMGITKAFMVAKRGNNGSGMEQYAAPVKEKLSDPLFVEQVYGMLEKPDTRGSFAFFTQRENWGGALVAGVNEAAAAAHAREVASAASGEQAYSIKSDSFRSTGELKASVISELAKL
jgi:superfamily II DNA or RNA helicase